MVLGFFHLFNTREGVNIMNISEISGVGVKRAKALKASGIYTISDLLNYLPRDYDDRSKIKTIAELTPDAVNTIRGKVSTEAENVILNRKHATPLNITKLIIKDNTGTMELIWFNQHYLKSYFKKNSEYIFTGKVRTSHGGKLQMSTPEYEACGKAEISGGRIVPIYTVPKQFTQKTFRALIHYVINPTASNPLEIMSEAHSKALSEVFSETLPESLLKEFKLCDRKTAVLNIHFPESNTLFLASRKRLVFEELFFMQSALLKMKGVTSVQQGIIFDDTDVIPFLSNLPFSPTKAQQRVLGDIQTDMKSGVRMNRLIQGDVGSGKTAVAMVAGYLTAKNGYQMALMAPTDILAGQHYAQCLQYFEPLGFEVVLLTGTLRAKAKRESLAKIQNGQASIIVGTHALIQESVEYKNLGLVITDEQHRFGVNQRLNLTQKAAFYPHTLVMTATPIPRTLALILYGDLDISIIDELPPGRQEIKTYSVTSQYRQRLHAFIQKEVTQGRQVYIICPAIEETGVEAEREEAEDEAPTKKATASLSEGSAPIQNVMNYTQEISEILPDLKISYLHGRMKPTEKAEIMDAFKAGEINLLVSTTVIEVGVHVSNATLMIIENAERFGLSQLHQLRGRVGRGEAQSYCVLITDSKNRDTQARMKAMVRTTDGFKLAELDLQLRNTGDFFGTRQHGIPTFKIANLYRDVETLKIAQSVAVSAIKGEIKMTNEEKNIFVSQVESVLEKAHGGVI